PLPGAPPPPRNVDLLQARAINGCERERGRVGAHEITHRASTGSARAVYAHHGDRRGKGISESTRDAERAPIRGVTQLRRENRLALRSLADTEHDARVAWLGARPPRRRRELAGGRGVVALKEEIEDDRGGPRRRRPVDQVRVGAPPFGAGAERTAELLLGRLVDRGDENRRLRAGPRHRVRGPE